MEGAIEPLSRACYPFVRATREPEWWHIRLKATQYELTSRRPNATGSSTVRQNAPPQPPRSFTETSSTPARVPGNG